MKKGDIVLVPFPFTDLSDIKKRPALILISKELDVTLAFISTQLKWKEATDIELQPDKSNGLKKESLVRLSKIATIRKDLVIGLLGELKESDLQLLDEQLIKLFHLK